MATTVRKSRGKNAGKDQDQGNGKGKAPAPDAKVPANAEDPKAETPETPEVEAEETPKTPETEAEFVTEQDAPAEETPEAEEEAEPTPAEIKAALVKGAAAAALIEGKQKCFACTKKAGVPYLRMQMGLVLCIKCTADAITDAAILADQVQDASLADAFGFVIPNITRA